ncbi:HAD family hydrolase [Demequina lutea]|uniref:Putative hydrolase of the HAD superfamily n=1 Tax=Demequina lutea TaxID=431489 RepID=A0A7Y9ZBT3_9MICO|nr:HAD family hydrolase [Demequina lutea]NYI41703.1 putative hydrolase of the HAD superfamily [Demequina lutea]
MTDIRAFGFDLDGTLLDHRGAASQAADALLRGLGVEPSDATRALWFAADEAQFEAWRAGRIGFQDDRRRRLQMVLPEVGVPVPGDDALDALFEIFLRAYRDAWRAFPDAAPVLTSLRMQGFRIGVLTNGGEEQQVAKLRTVGLYDLVDTVCTSEAIGVHKPDARAFEALASRLGVAPSQCFFVGDNPDHDVAGARAAGMPAALIDRYREGAEGLASVLPIEVVGR